ncbi:SemD/SinC family type III secretion system effector [Chlamydia sp. 17-3921]|uniref:SemD/SinC family type III secretion system effector n=1 Tax=Chlamydia sp. 17-3921 TaxID=2675798 RepID=UPI00191988BD|nr:hypothetical protein [Chlamydia sp. 17-3921]
MVNPTGGNNQGPWGVGSNQNQQDDSSSVQGSQSSSSTNGHSVSSSSTGGLGGLARRISSFFQSLFRGGSSSSSRRSSVSSSSSSGSASAHSLTPKRSAPPPPTSGAAGGPSPLARPPIKRPAPQPPTGGTAPKRPAPPPPTSGAAGGPSPLARPPIKRTAPQPPTGGPVPKRPAPPPPSTGKGIVDGLRKAVSEHEASRASGASTPERQTPLDKISNQLRDQWMKYEREDPVGYKLSGVNVLLQSLELSLSEQVFLSPEGGKTPQNFGPIKEQGINLMRYGLRNILQPGPTKESSSTLLKTLVSVMLEGPHLSPGESLEDFVQERSEDFNVNEDPDPMQGRMQEIMNFARQIDGMRTQHPGQMPRLWASLTRQMTVQLRSYGNNVKATNRGNYDAQRVEIEFRDSMNALKLMGDMDSSVQLQTLAILANDVIAGKYE